MPEERLGPYLIERELARGGMGVVYVARHEQLGRRVALKQLLDPTGLGTERERFKIEAEALAALQHPNIVRVHDVGKTHLGPYMAMDLVDGRSLKQVLEPGPLEPRQVATWGVALARALAHAHQRGILHRDLKPANVLLTGDGRPLLTDFGLAKDLHAERERLTRTGQMLGTPAFMSPEQADGDLERIGPATDVYGLGATLYHLLCGRPPFEGATAMNIVAKVLTKDPAPVRTHRPECEVNLQTIVLKCLEKEPAERYASAADLAADLERYLAGEPIQGQPPKRFRRWLRRNKRTLALVIVAVSVVVLAEGVSQIRGAVQAARFADGVEQRLARARKGHEAERSADALRSLGEAALSAESEVTRVESRQRRQGLELRIEEALGEYERALDEQSQGILDRILERVPREAVARRDPGDLTALDPDDPRAKELEALLYGVDGQPREFETLLAAVTPQLEERMSARLRARLALIRRVLRERRGSEELDALEVRPGVPEAASRWLERYPGHSRRAEALSLRMSVPLRMIKLPWKISDGAFLGEGDQLLAYQFEFSTDIEPVRRGESLYPETKGKWNYELRDMSSGSLLRPPWTLEWTSKPGDMLWVPGMMATNARRTRVVFTLQDELLWLDIETGESGRTRVGEVLRRSFSRAALDPMGQRLVLSVNEGRCARLLLLDLEGQELNTVLLPEDRPSDRMWFDPSGRTVLLEARRLQRRSKRTFWNSGFIYRWDLESSKLTSRPTRVYTTASAVDPQGRYFVTGDAASLVKVYELPSLEPRVFPEDADIHRAHMKFFRDVGAGDVLAGASPEVEDSPAVWSLAISPDGVLIYALVHTSAKMDRPSACELQVFHSRTGERLHARRMDPQTKRVELTADGERMLVLLRRRAEVRYAWKP